MNEDNPAYQLFQGTIPTVIKDVMENGQIGTASKRIIERIGIAVIKNTFFFNENSRKLRGSGARINKFVVFTRKGWRERKNENYLDEDYDFLGMGRPSVLTENIPITESIKADFEWDEWDQKDTEAGYEQLENYFKNALMEELPIIYEKRYINTILDGIKNGVQWYNDQGITPTPTLQVPQAPINYTDEDNTKAAVKTIKQIINKLIQLDNFLVYKPNRSKWVLLVNNSLDDALQELGAYQAFGDRVVGNRKTEGYLSNTPIKFIKDSVQVIMLQELPEWIPFIVWPKNEAFFNLSLLFTAPPTGFKSRVGYIGKSEAKMFFTIASDIFTNGKLSYWATKAEIWYAGTNGGTSINSVNAYFDMNDINTGNVNVNWSIDSTATAEGFTINVYDASFNLIYTGNPTAIDGTEELVTLENLPSGSYQIEIRIDETVDANSPIERAIFVSPIYQVRNKGYFQPVTGNAVPPEPDGDDGGDDPSATVSNVQTTNASTDATADGSITFDTTIAHFTSQGTASLNAPTTTLKKPVIRAKAKSVVNKQKPVIRAKQPMVKRNVKK